MKYSLLEITQTILSSMDSDEINSITDTVESQQVVEIVKTVYDDIISRSDLMTNKTLFNLVPSNDPAKPIMMSKPLAIDRIEWVKYNIVKDNVLSPVWNEMRFIPLEEFIDYMHSFRTEETNIETFTQTFDGFTVDFVYRNDTAPQYYTTYDDNQIFFDAYDKTVDDTLQASKTLCFGNKSTIFQKSDAFVPALQPQQFALLLNESKSLAWAELKQAVHAKAEMTARKNWLHLQRTRQQVPDQNDAKNRNSFFNKTPNFARQ